VRFDPQIKYAAELAARKQRRTLSSYIEWAIEQNVKDMTGIEGDFVFNQRSFNKLSINDIALLTWDVDEPDRIINLALYVPDLLSFEEQQVWKVVSECDYFWNGGISIREKRHLYENPKTMCNYDNVREKWSEILEIIDGKRGIKSLKSLNPPPAIQTDYLEEGEEE
jgi:hypothetical protein